LPSEADAAVVEEAVVDEARDALLEAVTAEYGDAIVETHLQPGQDLWIRVSSEAWGDTASYLRERQRFRFYSWLSAIDWLPSPFGRSLDSAVDTLLSAEEAEAAPAEIVQGVAGGDTRFQVMARVHNLTTNLGVTLKADVPGTVDGNDLEVGTWTNVYPGADWHEREVHEMFGIAFAGHPGLRNLYLPGNFEGHPLRKDFPLLARLVKPWPGIVDVEPMPEVPSTENTEAAAPDVPEDVSADVGEANSRDPEDSP
jgi:NADH-quinone oxidoreductase subunit C